MIKQIDQTPLFSQKDWHRLTQERMAIVLEIAKTESVDVDSGQIRSIIEANYALTPLDLKKDEKHISEPKETSFAAPRHGMPQLGTYIAQGYEVTVSIPFQGTKDLFNVVPSKRTSRHPYGVVQDNVLHMSFAMDKTDVEEFVNRYKSGLSEIQLVAEWIGYVNEEIEAFNRILVEQPLGIFQRRKADMEQARSAFSELNNND